MEKRGNSKFNASVSCAHEQLSRASVTDRPGNLEPGTSGEILRHGESGEASGTRHHHRPEMDVPARPGASGLWIVTRRGAPGRAESRQRIPIAHPLPPPPPLMLSYSARFIRNRALPLRSWERTDLGGRAETVTKAQILSELHMVISLALSTTVFPLTLSGSKETPENPADRATTPASHSWGPRDHGAIVESPIRRTREFRRRRHSRPPEPSRIAITRRGGAQDVGAGPCDRREAPRPCPSFPSGRCIMIHFPVPRRQTAGLPRPALADSPWGGWQ